MWLGALARQASDAFLGRRVQRLSREPSYSPVWVHGKKRVRALKQAGCWKNFAFDRLRSWRNATATLPFSLGLEEEG